MTQKSLAGHHMPQSGAVDMNRRGQRRDCRIAARAIVDGGEIPCRMVNLSPDGIALEVDSFIFLKIGSRLRVTCRELGGLVCFVRWGAHPRYGVEFDAEGKTSAAVSDFYDSLAPEQS